MALSSSLLTFLPQSDGYLPYFLLFLSTFAVIHTAVCYTSPPEVSMKQFSGPERPPPNALLAHVYGVKNVYTALIRGYAAYHMSNPQLYSLGMASFAGVIFLNGTELLVYRTARPKESAPTLIMSGSALLWMALQRQYYTGL